MLIDGQRMPPGFSIESLTPEQIERALRQLRLSGIAETLSTQIGRAHV